MGRLARPAAAGSPTTRSNPGRTRCPAIGSAAERGSTGCTCWSSAVLAPLLLLALVAAVSAVPAPTSASPPVLDSAGRAAATQAMLDWLSGPKPGLVDGRLLLWSGARVVQAPVTESASTAGDIAYSTEVDTFVVADGAGQRFTAEFQVALDGQGRARVLTLTWDVTRTTELPGTAAAKTTSGQSVSFDVLVTGADTAAPRVVAWGGPGSGPTLVPFGNAVAIGDLDRSAAPPAAGPTAAPPPAVTWEPPTTSHGPAG